MIWGAVLSAGRQAFQRYGATPQAEAQAVAAAQKLTERFRALNKNINCVEITELDRSSTKMQMATYFLLKGGFFGCCRRVAKYASAALTEIETSLAELVSEVPPQPVSCASLLARKLGASELHAVMASGFAGGIGLCGGGCGALGAAMWLFSLERSRAPERKAEFRNPKLEALVERFLKLTGYRFECSEIVGRTFSDAEDHAGYLRAGGCAELLEQLAAG